MIDLFALMLIHGLLALMALRLLGRDDLDEDPAQDDTLAEPETATATPQKPGRRR